MCCVGGCEPTSNVPTCTMQRLETVEHVEQAQGASISVKRSKKSKGKSSGRQTTLTTAGNKNSLEVTKPSPFAEAMLPRIPEFNANPKVSKPRAKKEPKPEKESGKGKKTSVVSDTPEKSVDEKAKDLGFSSEDENVEEISLAERIAKKSKAKKAVKQSTLTFKAALKETVDSDSDEDVADMDTVPPPVQREKRAMKRTNYAEPQGNDQSSDSDVIIEEEDSDDDFQIPRKTSKTGIGKSKSSESVGGRKKPPSAGGGKGKAKSAIAKEPEVIVDESPEEPAEAEVVKLTKKSKAKPSSLDSSESDLSPPPAKKKATEKPKDTKRTISEVDGSDDDFFTVHTKKRAMEKPKASKAKEPAKKPAKPRKTQATKTKKDSSQKTLLEVAVSKVAAKKTKVAPTLDEMLEEGSDDEEEVVPLSKRLAGTKKSAPSKAATKPATKPKSKVFCYMHVYIYNYSCMRIGSVRIYVQYSNLKHPPLSFIIWLEIRDVVTT